MKHCSNETGEGLIPFKLSQQFVASPPQARIQAMQLVLGSAPGAGALPCCRIVSPKPRKAGCSNMNDRPDLALSPSRQ